VLKELRFPIVSVFQAVEPLNCPVEVETLVAVEMMKEPPPPPATNEPLLRGPAPPE